MLCKIPQLQKIRQNNHTQEHKDLRGFLSVKYIQRWRWSEINSLSKMEYKIVKRNHSSPKPNTPNLILTQDKENFLLHNSLILTHIREHEKEKRLQLTPTNCMCIAQNLIFSAAVRFVFNGQKLLSFSLFSRMQHLKTREYKALPVSDAIIQRSWDMSFYKGLQVSLQLQIQVGWRDSKSPP